jgi:hypothetical protein
MAPSQITIHPLSVPTVSTNPPGWNNNRTATPETSKNQSYLNEHLDNTAFSDEEDTNTNNSNIRVNPRNENNNNNSGTSKYTVKPSDQNMQAHGVIPPVDGNNNNTENNSINNNNGKTRKRISSALRDPTNQPSISSNDSRVDDSTTNRHKIRKEKNQRRFQRNDAYRHEQRDAEVIGAIIREVSEGSTSPSTSGDSFHCLAKALRHILICIARTEGTYPRFELYGDTIPVSRSDELPSIDVNKIENSLRQAFLGGTTQTGYITLRDVKDVLKNYYGCTAHLICSDSGGRSKPGVLGLATAPVLVICDISNKKYNNAGKINKKKKTSSHTLALVQNDNRCNTLYDGDRAVDLTPKDMEKYKDFNKRCRKDETMQNVVHNCSQKNRLLKGAKKIFEMCHGNENSSVITRSFFIQRKEPNQEYRTDEVEEELEIKTMLS